MDRKANKTCSNCQKSFLRPAHLERHLETGSCLKNKGLLSCPNCQKTFLKPAHLQRHLQAGSCLKKKGLLACPNCQKTFTWPAFLDRHITSGTCTKPPSPFQCSVCHKSYSRKDRLMEHVRKFHPDKAPEKKSNNINDVKVFTCCGQRFQSPREVWRHRQIHHYAKIRDGTGNQYTEIDSSSGQSEDSNINTIEEVESYHMQDECDENITNDKPLESIVNLDNETGDEPPNPAPDNFGDLMEILHDGDAKQLFTKIGNTIVDRSAKKRFKTVKQRESFRLTPTALALCENGFAMEVLTKIIDELLNKYKEMGGLMQIKVLADSLHPPIVTSLFQTHLFSSLMLLNYIESVLSSKDKFLLDETLTIDVTHVADIEGGGRLDAPDIDSFIRRRTGSWDPKNSNDDFRCLGFCLAASILIEQRKVKGQQFTQHKFYKEPQQSQELEKLTQKLYTLSGIDSTKPCGIPELNKFQAIFNEQYGGKQIVVLDWENSLNKLYVGQPERNEFQRIHLLLFNNHFYLLWGIHSFLGNTNKFCEQCITVYNSKKHHTCEGVCSQCLREGCPALTPEQCNDVIECQRCYLVFRNLDCYSAHMESVCLTKRYRCTKCLQVVETSKGHDCGKRSKCKHCHEEVDLSSHQCIVQTPSERTCLGPETFNVVHFDVETGTNSDGRLVPYLICCSLNCDQCIDREIENCTICGKRYRSWYGWNCIRHFGRWFMTHDRIQKERTILTAHNAAKFDAYFIYNYLAECGYKPKLNFKSNNLLSMTHKKVQLKDSLQFLKCSLDKLPSILKFEGAKGFFAWKLVNRCESLDYVGPIPPPEDFGIHHMTDEKKKRFWSWYLPLKADPNYVYYMEKEAIEYCMMDTKILESAWKAFRKSCLLLTDNKLDPLIGKYFTLAAFSAGIYKTIFMEHEIGIIPWGGYRNPKRCGQSWQGSFYLEYLNQKRSEEGKTPLICANNSVDEVRIGPYKVDAYDRDSGEAYEVLGCYWHSHASQPADCLFDLRNEKHPTKTPLTWGDVNNQTLLRLRQIERTGHKVIPIWECEIKKQIALDPLLKAISQDRGLKQRYRKPLNPADAVFGGRVEAFKTRMVLTDEQIAKGWTLEYIDFCSLYPFVQWFFEFTIVPHPTILTDRQELDKLTKDVSALDKFLVDNFGLCYCTVIPPSNLRYAVLPYRARNKTVFCLCRTCAEEDSNEYCHHSDAKRSLEGVYTFHELKVALDRGYKIDYIFEIWNYGCEKAKIFEQYVTKMMAMKTLHSEIPDNMTAEEFCKIWNDRVPGINLNPKDMNPNPAMRLTAKILLNSLWGKFCERANCSFTTLANNWYDLKKRLDSKESVINRIEQISDKEMVLSCKVKDPFLTETSMYNPVIGAYVTAYARTTLLEKCLEVVGDRALYTDTDSLVYLRIPGEPDAPRGEALGQLANELKSDEFGTCFQCYAPKSLRLEVGKRIDSNSWEKKRVIMKTKGIHLTSLGSSIEKSINQRALWDQLIDARLITRSQAEMRQSIKNFYEQLGTEVPQDLVKPCLEAYLTQQWMDEEGENKVRSDPKAPGLFVPQPKLSRDRFTAHLTEERLARKLVRFRHDKSMLLNKEATWPNNKTSTVPYGYNL